METWAGPSVLAGLQLVAGLLLYQQVAHTCKPISNLASINTYTKWLKYWLFMEYVRWGPPTWGALELACTQGRHSKHKKQTTWTQEICFFWGFVTNIISLDKQSGQHPNTTIDPDLTLLHNCRHVYLLSVIPLANNLLHKPRMHHGIQYQPTTQSKRVCILIVSPNSPSIIDVNILLDSESKAILFRTS
jgi:hypothetical protein